MKIAGESGVQELDVKSFELPSRLDGDLEWYSDICRTAYVGDSDRNRAVLVKRSMSTAGSAIRAAIIASQAQLVESGDSSCYPAAGLLIGAPQEDALPWELAVEDAESEFRPFPLFRLVDNEFTQAAEGASWVSSRIIILVVAPRPSDSPYFDHRAEADCLFQVTHSQLGIINDVRIVRENTFTELIHTLHSLRRAEPETRIGLHFDGHGHSDGTGKTFLIFEDTLGRTDPIELSDFMTRLSAFQLSFVYCSSCLIGKRITTRPAFSPAYHLAKELGCPVLVMGFVVSVHFALAYCRSFYTCLHTGNDPISAFLSARTNCSHRGLDEFWEWHVPMLYCPCRTVPSDFPSARRVKASLTNQRSRYSCTIAESFLLERALLSGKSWICIDAAFHVDIRQELITSIDWLVLQGKRFLFVEQSTISSPVPTGETAVLFWGRLLHSDVPSLRSAYAILHAAGVAVLNIMVTSRFTGAYQEFEQILSEPTWIELSPVPRIVANPQVGTAGVDPTLAEISMSNLLDARYSDLARELERMAGSDGCWPGLDLFRNLTLPEDIDSHYIAQCFDGLPGTMRMICSRIVFISACTELRHLTQLFCAKLDSFSTLTPEQLWQEAFTQTQPATSNTARSLDASIEDAKERRAMFATVCQAYATVDCSEELAHKCIAFLANCGFVQLRGVHDSPEHVLVFVNPMFRIWLSA
jgi:hypothetical protein